MLRLTLKQSKAIVKFFGKEKDKIAVISTGEGHSGEGIYLGVDDHREEGSVFLGKQK